MKRFTIATIFVLAAGAAHAVSDPRKGTDGLTRLEYTVVNGGADALSCDVKLAHWYSDHLVTIAPGQNGAFTLWSDDASGAVYRMNPGGDRMPVERLWCGAQSDSWATRSEIDLPRHQSRVATGQRLSCGVEAGKTRCTAQ